MLVEKQLMPLLTRSIGDSYRVRDRFDMDVIAAQTKE
jgi:hypothetical protein